MVRGRSPVSLSSVFILFTAQICLFIFPFEPNRSLALCPKIPCKKSESRRIPPLAAAARSKPKAVAAPAHRLPVRRLPLSLSDSSLFSWKIRDSGGFLPLNLQESEWNWIPKRRGLFGIVRSSLRVRSSVVELNLKLCSWNSSSRIC